MHHRNIDSVIAQSRSLTSLFNEGDAGMKRACAQ